jgi:type IV pilus assembly protein PilA
MGNASKSIKGFTLIELMIVIAIVAILVTLAVPAYQDYVVRAKVAECISGAAPIKLEIYEYRELVGSWPPDANAARTAAPAGQSNYCVGFQHYKTVEGSFEINVNEAAVGVHPSREINVQLMPVLNAQGRIDDWLCLSRHTEVANLKFLPSNCQCKDIACAKS